MRVGPARVPVMLLCVAGLAASSACAAGGHSLTAAWDPRDPYLVEKPGVAGGQVTGLDAELVSAALGRAGITPVFRHLTWKDTLAGLRDGSVDLASGAYRNPERERYAIFSQPYRTEVVTLILRRGASARIDAATVAEAFDRIDRGRLRIGLVKGYYYGPDAARWSAAPDAASRIVESDTDLENLGALHEGKVDGVLIDRLVAATLAWRLGIQDELAEFSPPIFEAPISIMFSRRTVTPDQVERFDQAMRELRASGEYQGIVGHYLLPVLLSISTARPWFLFLALLGTAGAAVAGLAIARERGYSLVGALVLAALPSLGGGICRDVLVGRHPVGVLRQPIFPLLVLAIVVAGSLLFRASETAVFGRLSGRGASRWRDHLVEFADALGLGALSVVGVMVALEVKAAPLLLWGPVLAVITSGAGGVLGNILVGDKDHRNLIDAFYLEISLGYGFALSLFLRQYALIESYKADEIFLAVLITVVGAVTTRLIALRMGWRGLRI